MLKELRIQNFKGWKDTGTIRLAPISLFFGANSNTPSMIHDRNPAADLLHLFHIMRGINNGCSLSVQLLNSFQNPVSALRIHSHCRFIQNNQSGLVCNATGNIQPS